ncbi:peptidylprolyl isomerase [Paenibacillus allorhizoplanae]|uniref:peptidylprolyl isomerase n=1 Tax=Paenibacillus allorhizoplanae TaxID=2905648 RepID=UPI001F2C23EB|nr:peptidylprolyl isomerase [Paenibacillus allorhizoplanae]
MKFTKRIVVAMTVLPIVGAIVFYATVGADSGQTSIAMVNGSMITTQEFKSELNKQRASVIDYFYRSKGVAYGKNFWETDYSGENPEETAKKRALDEIIRFKIELELAAQHGLIQGTSYDDLLHEMDKENKRRLAAVKAREPIYGPVQLDESTFMNEYISKLRTQLKETLSEDELNVTEEDLKRHYELLKDTFFTLEDRIRFQKISVSYKEDAQSNTSNPKKQSIKKRMDAIKRLLDQGEEMDQAISELQGENDAFMLQFTEENLSKDTASTYFKSQAVLYSVLTDNLGVNQVSSVLDETMQGEYVLVKVVSREKSGYKSYDESKRNVWKNYVDTAYGDYLDKLTREAKVDIDESTYKNIHVH